VRQLSGFTLLQLIIVIAIIIVLATLSLATYSKLLARADRVQCTANLKNLYVAAELYQQEHESWPQILLSEDSDEPEIDYAMAWRAALQPYGPTAKTWICPTVQRQLENPDYLASENARIDYLATAFDDKPGTAHRWPKQPWFAEVVDVHGHGQLLILADGSVSDAKTLTSAPPPVVSAK
jgi:type II secretory pathway pseudopilin PulG